MTENEEVALKFTVRVQARLAVTPWMGFSSEIASGSTVAVAECLEANYSCLRLYLIMC